MAIKIRTIREYDEFVPLHPEWNRLVERTSGELSLTHEWIDSLWNSHHGRENQALIVLVEHDGRLKGIFPFFIKKLKKMGMTFDVLCHFTNYYCHHGNLICAEDDHETVRALFAYLEKEVPYDIIKFFSFYQDGSGARLLRELEADFPLKVETEPYDSMPYLPLQGTWQEYLNGTPKKFRENLRRKERRLAEKTHMKVRNVGTAGELKDALRDVIEIEGESWKGEKGSSIVQSGRQKRFFDEFTRHAAHNGWLALTIIYDGETPVAYNMGVRYGKVFSSLKTTYSDKYRELAPGTVIKKLVIEGLFGSDMEEHDFLGAPEPWKMEWTQLTRSHQNIRLYSKGLKEDLYRLVRIFKGKHWH